MTRILKTLLLSVVISIAVAETVHTPVKEKRVRKVEAD